jgi:hypothetical protein
MPLRLLVRESTGNSAYGSSSVTAKLHGHGIPISLETLDALNHAVTQRGAYDHLGYHWRDYRCESSGDDEWVVRTSIASSDQVGRDIDVVCEKVSCAH